MRVKMELANCVTLILQEEISFEDLCGYLKNPIWIIGTKKNINTIEEIKKINIKTNITTFEKDNLDFIIESIILHHGKYSEEYCEYINILDKSGHIHLKAHVL
jgi:hypothetical protein